MSLKFILKFKKFNECKSIWSIYLILFVNLNNKAYSKDYGRLSLNDQLDIIENSKDMIKLMEFSSFFNKVDLDIIPFIKNWASSTIFLSLSNFFGNLPYCFNSIRLNFFKTFSDYFNTINVFLLPSFLYKRVDVLMRKKKYINVIYLYNNIFFVNYDIYRTHESFFSFLFYNYNTYLLSLNYLIYFINFYSNIFQNIFYNDFSEYFITKDKILFCSAWEQTHKRFFINFFSTIDLNDDFYVQKKLFINYSSIKFTKYLNLNKRFNLLFPLKLIMIQHLRRMFICADINSFLLFFKTYGKDFKILFLNLNSPTNEIFINPLLKDGNPIICDILIRLNNFKGVKQHLNKYKFLIESLFLDAKLAPVNWDIFVSDFSNFLKLTDMVTSEAKFEKILIRYYFDCNVIFLSKKKMLPLKKKKAQSISRRRYKQIVKSSKRRFWVF